MIVMKFGGSSIESAQAVQRVVSIVRSHADHHPAVVVSAMGKTTDRLLSIARYTAAGNSQAASRELTKLRQFHLNDVEVELVANLIPKQQFLVKTPELAKIANLTVDAKSYWLYTNDPYDNQKRREAFEAYGFEQGLEALAEGRP